MAFYLRVTYRNRTDDLRITSVFPCAACEHKARLASAVASARLRCLVSYRAPAVLAEGTREGQPSAQADIETISTILARLQDDA